jgi:hypothetical protein
MKRSAMVLPCLGLIFMMVLAVPRIAVAQSEPALEDFEARYLEAVKVVEAQLQQASQQIEAEQKALLDKLGQTHEQLQAERRRADALEQQIKNLSGLPRDSAAVTTASEPVAAAAGGHGFLDLPARTVNALGMIERTERVAGQVPQGTERVVIVWPPDVSAPEGSVRPTVRVDGKRAYLEAQQTLGPARTLASWEVDGTDLKWSWHPASPVEMASVLAYLDTALPRCRFEAQRVGVTLATYQLLPKELRVAAEAASPQAVVLRPELGPLWLVVEQTPAQWILFTEREELVEWVSETRSWQVALGQDGASLTVRHGAGLEHRLRELARQREQWQQDLARSRTRGMPTSRIETELERIQKETQRLESIRQSLSGVAEPSGNPVVKLMTRDRHLVLARLILVSEAP